MKRKSQVLGDVNRTSRGFEIVHFKDRYGSECSLKMSSLADYEKPGTSALWLGIDDPDPKVMASKAESVGVQTIETCGWVPYPIPEDVLVNTRMHLDRTQVEALIEHLQSWLETDTLNPNAA